MKNEIEINQQQENGYLVVEFNLAQELYAIEAIYVREVYHYKELTPLPNLPSFVKGIINVRRQIIALLDLRVFFDLPVQEITSINKNPLF